jgi:hypothetical protein
VLYAACEERSVVLYAHGTPKPNGCALWWFSGFEKEWSSANSEPRGYISFAKRSIVLDGRRGYLLAGAITLRARVEVLS